MVKVTEQFAQEHSTSDRQFLLAAGSAGIEAATNIVVRQANRTMLLYVYGAVIVLCFVTFRSWSAVVVAVVPLAITSVLCEALMAALGMGVKLATLPVIALGVGIGVDHALYLLSVQLAQQRASLPLSERTSARRHAMPRRSATESRRKPDRFRRTWSAPAATVRIHVAPFACQSAPEKFDGFDEKPVATHRARPRSMRATSGLNMTILMRYSVGRILLHVLAMVGDRCVRFHLQGIRKRIARRALDARGARYARNRLVGALALCLAGPAQPGVRDPSVDARQLLVLRPMFLSDTDRQ